MLFQNIDFYVAYLSPLLYMLYVEIAKCVLPIEDKTTKPFIDSIKLFHNLGLSLASLLMLFGILYCAYESGKLNSIHASLCHRFNDEDLAGTVGRLFYLSKYWEWLDTAFLIIAGKKISWLQYTHHMSTAILVYVNIYPSISSASLLACFTNTFVHVFMYYYFAFPYGILAPYKKWITTLQIVQHCACLSGFAYIYIQSADCYSTVAGIQLALMLYVMYLTFFVLFYIVQYISNDGTSRKIDKKLQ